MSAVDLVCPICDAGARLEVAETFREENGRVLEGVLRCSNAACLAEYPILDGISVVRRDARDWLIQQRAPLYERKDLDPGLDTWLDDAVEPGGWAEHARRLISTYAWDHYGGADVPGERGLAWAIVDRLLNEAGIERRGSALDLGCATGGVALGLAGAGFDRVIGVDADAATLRVAAGAIRTGRARYALRRIGVVFDRVDVDCGFDEVTRSRVSLVAGDVLAMPFAAASADLCVMLNVVDCVQSPVSALHEAWRVLKPGGALLIAAPYDWAAHATPIEQWLGGHSPRGVGAGRPENVLRQLLTPGSHASSLAGCEILCEVDELPWRTRVHDRSSVEYRVHGFVARKAD